MKTLIREIEEEDFINQRIDVYANLIDEVAKEKNNFYSYEEYIKAVDALKRVFEKRKDKFNGYNSYFYKTINDR